MPASPTLPRVVYLRGAGNSPTNWTNAHRAMDERGWLTTSDRAQAWHLARGGCQVVKCDFSCDLDRTELPYYGYDRYVLTGLVRARYCPDLVPSTLGDGLPTSQWVRMSRHEQVGEAVLDLPVTVRCDEQELVWLNRADHPLPYRLSRPGESTDDSRLSLTVRLDEAKLADWVAEAFAAGKTLPAPQPRDLTPPVVAA